MHVSVGESGILNGNTQVITQMVDIAAGRVAKVLHLQFR